MNLLDLMVKIGIDDQATSKLGGIAGGITSGLGGAAKAGVAAIGAAVSAAGTGAMAIGKQALDAYASFEQLSGGIAKLYGNAGMDLEAYAQSVGQTVDEATAAWERNEQAQALMMQNAQLAYQTAGMSANQYMEQAMGMSAALVNSLGGDTVAAAELTDVAMQAMSDNINTFGTDAEMVQNAFQGFARGNYTMLDNLRLGYGQSKEEMQRLVADAAACSNAQEQLGMTVDATSLSFDNIVKAIQVVQYEQGIAGTTAREAATTIEGSVNMTKAAWTNLIAELGKDDGDVGARFEELVQAAVGDGTEANPGALGNIIPRARQIMESLAESLPEAMPMITDAMNQVIPAITDAITLAVPALLEAGGTVIGALAAGRASPGGGPHYGRGL